MFIKIMMRSQNTVYVFMSVYDIMVCSKIHITEMRMVMLNQYNEFVMCWQNKVE